MAKPAETLWKLEEHSAAKHRLLRRYADRWLPIMATQAGRLVLVDGFAGPGRYLGGEPGSPLILLDAFLEHKARARIRSRLVYIFIEEHRGRFEHLCGELDRYDLPRPQVEVYPIHGRYEDEIAGALDRHRRIGGLVAPTFAFVDPFGYSDAPMHLTGRVLGFSRAEVLVYVPLPWIARFVGRAGQEDALNALYGSDEWKPARQLRGTSREGYLHDLFRDKLAASMKGRRSLVRSFEIETAAGGGYYLFFGTGNPTGLEKMKEAMWGIDPARGQRFRDTTLRDHPVLFEPDVNTQPLVHALRSHFGGRAFTIEEAERFTLLETAYLPRSHLKTKTLVPLERDGQLEVLTERARARTYPASTRLRFKSS